MSKLDTFKIDYSDTWNGVKDKLNGVIDYCAEYFNNKMNNSTNGIITESDGVNEKLYLVNPENMGILTAHKEDTSTFESHSLLGAWALVESYNSIHPPIESTADITSGVSQSLKNTVLAISATSMDNYYCIFRTQYRTNTKEEVDFIIDLLIKNDNGSFSSYTASMSNTGINELDNNTETYRQFTLLWRTMNEYNVSMSIQGGILLITAYIPVIVGYEMFIYEEIFKFDWINRIWLNPTSINQEITIDNSFGILKQNLHEYPLAIVDYIPINVEIDSTLYRGLTVVALIKNRYTVNLSNYSGIISSKQEPIYSVIPPKIFNIDGVYKLVYKPSKGLINIGEVIFGTTFDDRTSIHFTQTISCYYSDYSIIAMDSACLILSSVLNNCLVIHNLIDLSVNLIPLSNTVSSLESSPNEFMIFANHHKTSMNKYFYKNFIRNGNLIILQSQFVDFIIDTQSKTFTSHAPLRLTDNNIAVRYDINSSAHKFYYEWMSIPSMNKIRLVDGLESPGHKIVTNLLGLFVVLYNPTNATVNALNTNIVKFTIYNSESELNITNRLTGKNHE